MKFVALFSIYTLDTFLDNHNFCDIKIVRHTSEATDTKRVKCNPDETNDKFITSQ